MIANHPSADHTGARSEMGPFFAWLHPGQTGRWTASASPQRSSRSKRFRWPPVANRLSSDCIDLKESIFDDPGFALLVKSEQLVNLALNVLDKATHGRRRLFAMQAQEQQECEHGIASRAQRPFEIIRQPTDQLLLFGHQWFILVSS